MTGLVLEGGGAKGSYHIGAYKALRELGMKIEGITGTSIGAINGAMIVQDGWEEAYNLWYNMDSLQLFEIEPEIIKELKGFNFTQDNIKYLLDRVKQLFHNRGIDIRKIKKVLTENINERMIRNSDKDFGIVTFNLSSLKPMELFIEDIPDKKLVDYLIASSYLPVFKMEKMNGSIFLDGGFYDNLPVNMIVKKGYKDIIAVRTFGLGRIRKVDEEGLNISYIAPKEDLGSILDFDRERMRYNLKLGYYDTLRVFSKLSGEKYYFDTNDISNIDKYTIDFFLNFDSKKIKRIAQMMNIQDTNGYRVIFEIFIPFLARLFNLESKYNYQDILFSLLEYAGNKYKIERFEIYQLDKFIDKIERRVQKDKIKPRKIPGVFTISSILPKTVKEDMLNYIITSIF